MGAVRADLAELVNGEAVMPTDAPPPASSGARQASNEQTLMRTLRFPAAEL